MLLPHVLKWIFPIGLTALGTTGACGQAYPSKPIRFVVAEVGGSSDFASRLIAQPMSAALGQAVIIDNRGSTSTGQIVAKAPPDGYTLLMNGSGFWLTPLLQTNVSYDAVKDFASISMATTSPNVLIVHPAMSVKSVKELIALAKAKPGELNYGSAPAGTPSHLTGELFISMAGINIVRVSYKGTGPSLNALIGGEIQLSFTSAGAATPHLNSGRLRALAVTSAQPSTVFPGMPTVAASGLPGYEAATVLGVWALAKTPNAIITRLNQEIVRTLNQADVKDKLFSAGLEVVASPPEQLTAFIKSDVTKWAKVIKDANIRAD